MHLLQIFPPYQSFYPLYESFLLVFKHILELFFLKAPLTLHVATTSFLEHRHTWLSPFHHPITLSIEYGFCLHHSPENWLSGHIDFSVGKSIQRQLVFHFHPTHMFRSIQYGWLLSLCGNTHHSQFSWQCNLLVFLPFPWFLLFGFLRQLTSKCWSSIGYAVFSLYILLGSQSLF